MNISELLQFVDEAMYAKTGKHLNDLQRKIMKGVLDHQKYSDIADSYDLSEGHVKDVGYELLQMMTKTFNEPISKGNVKSVLERKGDVNFCFDESTIFNITEQKATTIINQQKSQPESDKVKKLKKFGLSDEQIADVLEMDVDDIENMK